MKKFLTSVLVLFLFPTLLLATFTPFKGEDYKQIQFTDETVATGSHISWTFSEAADYTIIQFAETAETAALVSYLLSDGTVMATANLASSATVGTEGYSFIDVKITNTQGSEVTFDGNITLTSGLSVSDLGDVTASSLVVNTTTVLNQAGGDSDTRIEGDTNTSLVFVDASTDRVGIGTSTPATLFDVAGVLTVSGNAIINESGDSVDTRVEGNTNANLLFVDASADRVGIGTNSPGALLDVGGVLSVASGAVINEDGDAVNIRMEGDTDTNLLYVDGGNNRVGIGMNNPGALFDVDGVLSAKQIGIGDASPAQALRVLSSDAGNWAFAVVQTETYGFSAEVQEITGTLCEFSINHGSPRDYAFVVKGTGCVGLGLQTPTVRLHVSGNMIINENADDLDSRVEGSGDANLLYVEAGNNRVGIGTATPATKLHVAGDITEDNMTYIDMGCSYNVVAVGIATADIYYVVTPNVQGYGPAKNASITDGVITVTKAGVYRLALSLSVSSAANKDFHGGIAINGTDPDGDMEWNRAIGASADEGSVSAGGIRTLAASDTISAVIENTADTSNPTVAHMNLSVFRIAP